MKNKNRKPGQSRGAKSIVHHHSAPDIYICPADSERSGDKDLSEKGLFHRLLACILEIKKVQFGFQDLGECEYYDHPIYSISKKPWDEREQERTILRRRHVEQRHKLLNHILADLLEIISHEAGLEKIDSVIYPHKRIPAELADES